MKYYNFDCGCFFKIKENGSLDFDINNINQDCPAVWDLLAKGLTTGVFQLETETGKNWSQKLKPTSINHLCALGSILRPGCLNSKDENGISLTEHYCRRKNREEEVTYPHPELEDLLRETYGVNCYQEQSLEILKKLGGFNLVEADLARRGIGKKKAEVVEQVHQLFIKKTQEIGKISLEKAEEIFNLIKAGERYSFNKCVSGDTKILCPNGDDKTVKELLDIRYIDTWGKLKATGFSLNKDETIVTNRIINVYRSGIDNVFKTTLENKSTIKTNLSHKFPVFVDFKYIELTLLEILSLIGFGKNVKFVFWERLTNDIKFLNIESIEYLGKEEVYDVQMDAPNHNFIANDGIVTCNSHAYSYGLMTYWTAYLKVHSPILFFVSKLRHAHYKQNSFEKISDLVLDAKLFNVEVKLPNLTHKKPWFWTDNKFIYYGLTDIKSIGESSFNSIINIIESAEKELEKPLKDFSFLEFCLFCGWDIAEKTTKLINSGALDFFKKTRTEMSYLFDLIKDFTKDVEHPLSKTLYLEKKPKDFIEFFELAAKNRNEGGIASNCNKVQDLVNKLKVLRNPTSSLLDTVDSVIWNEEDLLGISITYDSNKFDVDTHCKDILNGKTGTVVLGVKIKSIYKNIIKTGNNKGREMAKLSITDHTGNLTALVFADTWDKMKDSVSEGQQILIKGQKQKDNNNFILRELCQTI